MSHLAAQRAARGQQAGSIVLVGARRRACQHGRRQPGQLGEQIASELVTQSMLRDTQPLARDRELAQHVAHVVARLLQAQPRDREDAARVMCRQLLSTREDGALLLRLRRGAAERDAAGLAALGALHDVEVRAAVRFLGPDLQRLVLAQPEPQAQIQLARHHRVLHADGFDQGQRIDAAVAPALGHGGDLRASQRAGADPVRAQDGPPGWAGGQHLRPSHQREEAP